MSDLTSPFIIFVAFALYGILHSFLVSKVAKDWARKKFGEKFYERVYRLAFNFISVITLLPILFLVVWLPDRLLYSAPGFLRPFMIAGQAAAVLILAAALNKTDALDFAGLRQLRNQSTSPPLVTDGVYRWMRHPLYTGSMLFLWLVPDVSINYFAFSVAVTLYFIIGAVWEERKLEKYFGSAYVEYKRRTPMFIPWPRLRK